MMLLGVGESFDATKTNDAAEDKATFELFGDSVPCSSTKGATGHLLGAAGITEAILSMLAIETDIIPASVHTREVDRALKSRYLTRSKAARLKRALSNSFGFGGSNCSIVLGSST
jgi:3-oxoacyl-[acyl-carrier-protein] synthase-1